MTLAHLFSDHMVLQRDREARIWGWDEPGQTVTAGLADYSVSSVADSRGRFELVFPAMPFGGPYTLVVKGSTETSVTDVMVGEVWVCSGQSNMQWSMNQSNDEEALSHADCTGIRLFDVPRVAQAGLQEDVDAEWKVCVPETVGGFSAVAYYFGRDLRDSLHVPIGLIHTSWGGTRAEAWTSREKLQSLPYYKKMIEEYIDGLDSIDDKMLEYQQCLSRWEKTHYPDNPADAGFKSGYADLNYDDSSWREMSQPGSWQSRGEHYSGVFWFRRTVELPASWSGDLRLCLGPLDKSDDTYVNGQRVGGLSIADDPDAWSVPREYTVPANLWRPGKNVIAVSVFSHMYAGGFMGTPSQMYLTPSGEDRESIDLAGTWRFYVTHNFNDPDDPRPQPPMSPSNQNAPGNLFNNMLSPLIGYGIRGVIWYQGESNANPGEADRYHELFAAMIEDWRERWGYDFPFYFVQLANYLAGMDFLSILCSWPIIPRGWTEKGFPAGPCYVSAKPKRLSCRIPGWPWRLISARPLIFIPGINGTWGGGWPGWRGIFFTERKSWNTRVLCADRLYLTETVSG